MNEFACAMWHAGHGHARCVLAGSHYRVLSPFPLASTAAMRIIVLGAGIVGITSAYRLMADGHQVTLVDRADGPATETSWGNAGLISTGHAFAWGSLPALSAGLKGLAGKGGGFVFADHRNPDFWRWALRFARECTPSREEANTRAKNQLCLYSQQLWSETYQDTGIDAPRKQEGVLYLYRDAKALARAARMSRIMRQNGQDVEVLDAAATLRTEPGLTVLSEGLAGALHAPGDASGSCHAFSTALLAHLSTRGLGARFRTRVLGLVEQGGRITGVWTDAGGIDADAVVVALGPEAAPFLAQHGVRVPVYPVKGYSLHVEGVSGNGGPRLDGVDKAAGIAWRRQGQEVRLTTGAVFAGQDRSLDLAAIAALRAFGQRLFGSSWTDSSGQGWQETPWAGFRPMTPKGLPVVFEQQPGLWINIGHGHMGWTMAHATAQILADSMAGRAPVMRLAGF